MDGCLKFLSNVSVMSLWCDRNPYSQREDERLVSSWERFSEFIKYKRRYFFLQQKEEDDLVARTNTSPQRDYCISSAKRLKRWVS